ncbi:MAG TPA: SpoIIE family protein phosphatase [Thermoanaerobaculia bacterium]|nr:SpoIIE family protein phosphatase [Thermoanaerobaculia bacterium]
MDTPTLRLQITPAEGAPFDYSLRGETLVVGRAMDADLTLADPFLSRRHSRFFRTGADLFVEDLGSRNGTIVNGQAIQQATRVRPGDVVKISNSVIAILAPAPVKAPEPADDFLDGTVFRRASDLLDRQSAPAAANAADLRRYAERLKLLNEVHQALGRSLTLEELLELILDRAFDHLRPDRGAILLKEKDGGYRPAASRSSLGGPEGLVFSRSLVREVAEKGMAAIVFDVQADERFATAQSMLLSGIRSLIAAPLLDPEGSLGLIVLESRAGIRQFSEEDLELLVSLAAVAALHLRNLALALEAAERRRLQEELALARRIQVALLPDRLPEVPGWELYGGNIPSRGVSGDYYEVVTRGEGRECVLMVADVAGKGMAASLLTVSLQALSAGPIEDGLPPDEICARLSRQLYRRTPPEKYATAFLGILETATGRLRYTNAGHNPPLILRAAGTAEELGATGVPIGLLPQATYSVGETVLGPGDVLVLYTDGLVEAGDPEANEYGLERLQEVCLSARGETCESLARILGRDLEAFARGVPFADDRTLVLARRLEDPLS